MKILNHSIQDGKHMDSLLSHRNFRTLLRNITLQKIDDQNYCIGGSSPYAVNITGHNALYIKALEEHYIINYSTNNQNYDYYTMLQNLNTYIENNNTAELQKICPGQWRFFYYTGLCPALFKQDMYEALIKVCLPNHITHNQYCIYCKDWWFDQLSADYSNIIM